MARTKHNFLHPLNPCANRKLSSCPQSLQYSNQGINKIQTVLLCIQMTNHLIFAITTFSVSLKACLTFSLDLSSPLKSCLRRMIASPHKHFIIPMYFTVSDVKYLHKNTIKESVVRHSLTVEAVQELGRLATPQTAEKTFSNAYMDAQETCQVRLDLNNSTVCL